MKTKKIVVKANRKMAACTLEILAEIEPTEESLEDAIKSSKSTLEAVLGEDLEQLQSETIRLKREIERLNRDKGILIEELRIFKSWHNGAYDFLKKIGIKSRDVFDGNFQWSESDLPEVENFNGF